MFSLTSHAPHQARRQRGTSVLCITTPPEEGDLVSRCICLYRADFSVLCGYVLEEDRSAVVRQHYKDCPTRWT
jgi:hypothetical protein